LYTNCFLNALALAAGVAAPSSRDHFQAKAATDPSSHRDSTLLEDKLLMPTS